METNYPWAEVPGYGDVTDGNSYRWPYYWPYVTPGPMEAIVHMLVAKTEQLVRAEEKIKRLEQRIKDLEEVTEES